MNNEQGLEHLFEGIRRRQRNTNWHNNYSNPAHSNPNSSRQYDLRAIVLPLSQQDSAVYIDNLIDIISRQKRDSISDLFVYTFQEQDRYSLCERVARVILSYRDRFPVNYDTSLSKKDKVIGWGLIATILPSSILELISRAKTTPLGETSVEKVKMLSGVTGILDSIKVGLGLASGLTFGGIGSLAGIEGAISGALTGFAVGYYSPAIAGATYMYIRKKGKTDKRQEYDRVRNSIANISTQVRLQEIPIFIEILPDFRIDNIQPYLQDRVDIEFREPLRIIDSKWVYKSFKSIVKNPDSFFRVTYNMQRYYRRKIRDYEGHIGANL